MNTAKCQFYTERIVMNSSNEELYQIVNTLSNIYPPKFLQTIYSSTDIPSIFIRQFSNKVKKLRADIVSKPVITSSTLFTGTTTATFSSLETCHNSQSKNAFLVISGFFLPQLTNRTTFSVNMLTWPQHGIRSSESCL